MRLLMQRNQLLTHVPTTCKDARNNLRYLAMPGNPSMFTNNEMEKQWENDFE
jgi:hypothetical protein